LAVRSTSVRLASALRRHPRNGHLGSVREAWRLDGQLSAHGTI
jgi:hypothetical protein